PSYRVRGETDRQTDGRTDGRAAATDRRQHTQPPTALSHSKLNQDVSQQPPTDSTIDAPGIYTCDICVHLSSDNEDDGDALFKKRKIPEDWRIAYITANYKKESVSTSVICKLMESILRRDDIPYEKKYELFSNKQFGFISGRSTVLQS
ncbi:putative RNA-directed DNA polymerase from transposon BS-like 7, partial [Homarus americanus]